MVSGRITAAAPRVFAASFTSSTPLGTSLRSGKEVEQSAHVARRPSLARSLPPRRAGRTRAASPLLETSASPALEASPPCSCRRTRAPRGTPACSCWARRSSRSSARPRISLPPSMAKTDRPAAPAAKHLEKRRGQHPEACAPRVQRHVAASAHATTTCLVLSEFASTCPRVCSAPRPSRTRWTPPRRKLPDGRGKPRSVTALASFPRRPRPR